MAKKYKIETINVSVYVFVCEVGGVHKWAESNFISTRLFDIYFQKHIWMVL